MYAIIGKYKVRMEESGLILRHATGISFDLTAEETLGLLDFIKAYQQVLISTQPKTEPITQPVVRFVMDEDDR
jgi:hypothetical protein